MRSKIDYGIHITPSFACMAKMDDGVPVVVKTNTLRDTMPMCIGFNKKGSVLVGDIAWNSKRYEQIKNLKAGKRANPNIYLGFTRVLGTDKTYYSSNVNQTFTSEELLAEVFKKLRSFVGNEEIEAVVLTHSVKFNILQKESLIRAGKLAGFKQVELIQEPIAASISYGLNNHKKNGYWLVFDFGGGTFDAALVKVEEDIMKVVDADGDNHLGEKNLDMAIVDEIILPYLQQEYVIDSILEDENKKQLLREAVRYLAAEAKFQLYFEDEHNILSELGDIPGEDDEGEEFELDITVDREKLKSVIGRIFQRSIDITKNLIQRNNLTGGKLDALILVGGPTYSTILREMLEEQIKKPDTSADPITAVAKGAALYASTIEIPDEIKEASRDKTKIQLDIGHESSTVETEEWVTLKILPEKTEGAIPKKVFAEIVRGDKAWSSGKIEIIDKGEIIEVKLHERNLNNFEISIFDKEGKRLASRPDSFCFVKNSNNLNIIATSPDKLKERLIHLYSNHPEIQQDKFKALFDELFEYSENKHLTDTNIKRLKEIEQEINELE